MLNISNRFVELKYILCHLNPPVLGFLPSVLWQEARGLQAVSHSPDSYVDVMGNKEDTFRSIQMRARGECELRFIFSL